jgi:hypothetical protein
MSHESLNVERLAGRYGFLERSGLLPLPSKDGITIVVELSRLECATACLTMLLLYSGTPLHIIAVSMNSAFPLAELAGQFSPEQPVIFLPYEQGEYMPNQALSHIETSYAVLLEDSIMISSGWLSELMWVIFDDASVSVVAPRSSTESGEGETRLHFGTHSELAAHVSYSLGRHQGEWREAEVLTGSCFLFTKDLLQRIGGFDATLQARHLIIADWCLRARQTGAKLAFSDAVYVHAIHSLEEYPKVLNETKQTDAWKAYSAKWELETVLENELEYNGQLVPVDLSLQPIQPVIPIGNSALSSPLVTAIVYFEVDRDSDEFKQQWMVIQEQQSYKNIRWIWIRDTLAGAAPGFPVNEHDVVITVHGEDAWLRALRNASGLYESEITMYMSASVMYDRRYVDQAVKVMTEGSVDLIVSLTAAGLDEAEGNLYGVNKEPAVLPLERIAFKSEIIPGKIVSKRSASTSHQLQLHPEVSLSIGYIRELSGSMGNWGERLSGREAQS